MGFRHGTKGGGKYGLQPVRSWMELNRWDCAPTGEGSRLAGYNHLYLAIVGRTPPGAPLCCGRSVPQILGAELPNLFTPQAIAPDFFSIPSRAKAGPS